MKRERWHLKPYLQALPGIIYYQIVSSAILSLAVWGLKKLSGWLLLKMGQTSLTSGSFLFLFRHWEGYVLIALGLLVLGLYTAFDLNLKILYSDAVLKKEKISTVKLLKESAASFVRFAGIRGVLIIVFTSLIAPLAGVGLSISLTSGLSLPDFITSVIYSTPVYLIVYTAALVLIAVTAIRYIFTFHEIVLDQQKPKDAMHRARALLHGHTLSFLVFFGLFSLVMAAAALAVIMVFFVLAGLVPDLLRAGTDTERFLSILLAMLGLTGAVLAAMAASPLEILEITRYYRMYQEEKKIYVPYRQSVAHHHGLVAASVMAAVVIISVGMTFGFDEIFPPASTVGIIAHRTGGTLAFENSAEGIGAAAAYGVSGCETDVQRTADGYYIINHDNTFERLYGVDQKPSEMTLAQIEALETADGQTVPTLEELLDAAKENHVKLYIELKGESADEQMADDVAAMIRAKDMVNDTAVISLQYDVLDYCEQNYPEIETGYLYFLAYGDTTKLNVDDLIIEESLANDDTVDAIHAAHKKVMVWTVNSEEDLAYQLAGRADGIITDAVKEAAEEKKTLAARSDRERIIDGILRLLS